MSGQNGPQNPSGPQDQNGAPVPLGANPIEIRIGSVDNHVVIQFVSTVVMNKEQAIGLAETLKATATKLNPIVIASGPLPPTFRFPGQG